MQKMTTESPRVIWLSGLFFFLFSATLIVSWDAPNDGHRVRKEASLSDCEWRSRMAMIFPERRDHLSDIVNDVCGTEARNLSERLISERLAIEKKRVLPDESDSVLNNQIVSMTVGYPIELMATSIAKYDREVAALLVGIAKKESNWGKRVPRSSDGEDCYNYWGFKGAGSRGVAMGHGCFGTPEEAVERVGDRIAELVRIRGTGEPKNFTIWKCGSSCATHSPESVRKWVSDVDRYYRVLASR